jgi:hypothetical protein
VRIRTVGPTFRIGCLRVRGSRRFKERKNFRKRFLNRGIRRRGVGCLSKEEINMLTKRVVLSSRHLDTQSNVSF